MNTHSKVADGRMEVMSACAIRAGADADTAGKILDCITTEAALEILEKIRHTRKDYVSAYASYRRCITKKKRRQDSNWNNCIFK